VLEQAALESVGSNNMKRLLVAQPVLNAAPTNCSSQANI
jgi:hypothetical protein